MSSTKPPPEAARLLEMINASWMTGALHTATALRIPDLLAEGDRSARQLADATGCEEPPLRQLLRALCTLDVCRELPDGRFQITPLGSLLGESSPHSLRSWALYWGSTAWSLWTSLTESVRTGRGARERLTGIEGFGHLQRDEEQARLFNQAMVELTRLMAPAAAEAYDFDGRLVVDIGGGYGELLAAILDRHPHARGMLFDMEHAVRDARDFLERRGLASRCQVVAGDFFVAVPAGADVYVLKSVIHDWADDRARVILQRCREAMRADSRLLLVERLMPSRLEPTPGHRAIARSDLHMLAGLGAKERTLEDFSRLLEGAGLRLLQHRSAGAYELLEAAAA